MSELTPERLAEIRGWLSDGRRERPVFMEIGLREVLTAYDALAAKLAALPDWEQRCLDTLEDRNEYVAQLAALTAPVEGLRRYRLQLTPVSSSSCQSNAIEDDCGEWMDADAVAAVIAGLRAQIAALTAPVEGDPVKEAAAQIEALPGDWTSDDIEAIIRDAFVGLRAQLAESEHAAYRRGVEAAAKWHEEQAVIHYERMRELPSDDAVGILDAARMFRYGKGCAAAIRALLTEAPRA